MQETDIGGLQSVDSVIQMHVSSTDNEGHTLLHWAAKRPDGDAAFVQFWTQYVTPVNLRTSDGTGMTALGTALTTSGVLGWHMTASIGGADSK